MSVGKRFQAIPLNAAIGSRLCHSHSAVQVSPDKYLQWIISLSPTTHFTELSQAILYRSAGLQVVWPSFLALLVIGPVLSALSLARFRKTIAQLA